MAIVTRSIEQYHVEKICEDFPIILLDMSSSSELYYSLHGRLYFDEVGLDTWVSFSGKDHEIFSREAIIYIYNPSTSSGTLNYKYDEYPETLEACSDTCSNYPTDRNVVQEYVI